MYYNIVDKYSYVDLLALLVFSGPCVVTEDPFQVRISLLATFRMI